MKKWENKIIFHLTLIKLIANFDKALSHPNKEDLKTLEQIVILYEEK